MIKKSKLFGLAAVITAIVAIAIIGVGVASCSGPEGPIGPEGPQGPAGSSGTDGSDGSDGSDGQSGADGRPATPVVVYIITFDSGDGSAIDPESLMKGGKATEPKHPTRPFTAEQLLDGGPGLYRTGNDSGWVFVRWLLDGEPYDFDLSVTTDITLTAEWAPPGKISTGSGGIGAAPADADFVDKALAFVIANPASYYLVINDDYSVATTKTATATGITLNIIGLESERTITSATPNGKLFDINNTARLNLRENIILNGKAGTLTEPLINITNGTLNMFDGSKITGHTTSDYRGTIYLNGNTASFVMDGGEISDNRTTSINTTAFKSGIITIEAGTFTMNDGAITENTLTYGASICVFNMGTVANPIFYMNGGSITKNTSTNGTGGVCLYNRSSFFMNGGTITENTSTAVNDAAGGVYTNMGLLVMSGGSIIGNTGPGYVGDVFNMSPSWNPTKLSGNATIGSYVTPSGGISFNPVILINNWKGTIQDLYLWANVPTMPTVITNWTTSGSNTVLRGYDGYTLVAADVDKLKNGYFLNSNLIRQDFASAGRGILRTGTGIGNIL
jgi:hypothetical protein